MPFGCCMSRCKDPICPVLKPRLGKSRSTRLRSSTLHRHRLAVDGGDRGDAEIDVVAAERQLDAPILGQPPFCDVEARQDLDARDHGCALPRGNLMRQAQETVDPVAHEQRIDRRLDVDVGRARVDGARDDAVDEADDRRLAGAVPQPLQVMLAGIDLDDGLLAAVGPRVLGIEGRDQTLEFRRRDDLETERMVDDEANGLHRHLIERVDHRQDQGVALDPQRHDAVLGDETRRQLVRKQTHVRRFVWPIEGHVQELRQARGEIPIGHDAELRQHLIEAIAGRFGDALRPLQRQRIERAAGQEAGKGMGEGLVARINAQGLGSDVLGHDPVPAPIMP